MGLSFPSAECGCLARRGDLSCRCQAPQSLIVLKMGAEILGFRQGGGRLKEGFFQSQVTRLGPVLRDTQGWRKSGIWAPSYNTVLADGEEKQREGL